MASEGSATGKRPATLQVAGLFSGIGGLELGLRQAGHEIRFLCEIDSQASKVLEAHYPRVPLAHDIRNVVQLPHNIDLIAAGFPCQDLSAVGRTTGIEGRNSGLINEVFRILKRSPCEWVLLENVPFMLQLHKGRAIKYIASKLEHLGYRWAYRTLDTRAFGIPQRRERVFLLASLNHDPGDVLFREEVEPRLPAYELGIPCGFYWTEGNRGLGWAVNAIPTLKGGSGLGIPSPPAIWLRRAEIVTPHLNDGERFQGFEPGWTEPTEHSVNKGHRWRLLGNAVTVPVARWIGERLAVGRNKLIVSASPLSKSQQWPAAAFGGKGQRSSVKISSWPKHIASPALNEFLLCKPTRLSEKAAAGFLARLERSTLRCPAEFKESLRLHITAMRKVSVVIKSNHDISAERPSVFSGFHPKHAAGVD
jgi:DNA (cytosine-5)-methyltransferase 1